MFVILKNFALGLALTLFTQPVGVKAEGIDRYQHRWMSNSLMRHNFGASKDAEALTITWFGAASILLDDGANSILIDPFVSRENNRPVDIFLRRDAEIDTDRVERRSSLPEYMRANAILVSHSHYDHILDVPAFAKRLRIPVFGSASSKRILNAHGAIMSEVVQLGDKFGNELTGGSFQITAFPGKHGRPPLLIDPLNRSVSENFKVPASINSYGRGEVYTYFIEHKFGSVLHIGSAGVVPNSLKSLRGKVDVVLLSLIGRGNTRKYLQKVIEAVDPHFVIPIHYDSIFQPVEAPIKIVAGARLKEFFLTMDEFYSGVETGIIKFDEPWLVSY